MINQLNNLLQENSEVDDNIEQVKLIRTKKDDDEISLFDGIPHYTEENNEVKFLQEITDPFENFMQAKNKNFTEIIEEPSSYLKNNSSNF